MTSPGTVARAAETIHWAFDDYHQRFRSITRRVKKRFERRDWEGVRQDTVERLGLHGQCVRETLGTLGRQLGDELRNRELWSQLKTVYTGRILGRDDFELAQTFFNSLSRKLLPHVSVDPAIDYVSSDFPVPYKGWEMASARMYGAHRVDASVVRRILEDAGFGVPFRDLDADTEKVAARIEGALVATFGDASIEALDVVRPVFIRNKAAYLVGRARRGSRLLPVVLAVLHTKGGLEVDAVVHEEDTTSILFSFARWYFHADVESPREVIGFLHSLLPRKRISELYISLGYNKHGKTEFYGDLMGVLREVDERFVVAPGQRGLVMAVFTLPSYEFVFKVIRDTFPPSKLTTRRKIMDQYRRVFSHDRVGRLVDFQEFEDLAIPRARFSDQLLAELLEVAGKTVTTGENGQVVVRHAYVGRRVTPLDLYLNQADPEEAEVAVVDWGWTLKDLAAANIFPGDLLLKNFGVTRHGRVVSYDYDEVALLTECNFRRMPAARNPHEEMASEPWFGVGEHDIFPEEFDRFLELSGTLREVFEEEHGDLLTLEYWREMQERNRHYEMIDFFPYPDEDRLRPELDPSRRLTASPTA